MVTDYQKILNLVWEYVARAGGTANISHRCNADDYIVTLQVSGEEPISINASSNDLIPQLERLLQ